MSIRLKQIRREKRRSCEPSSNSLTLSSPTSTSSTHTVLADRCVEILDTAATGILLADDDGHLRVIAASSEQARLHGDSAGCCSLVVRSRIGRSSAHGVPEGGTRLSPLTPNPGSLRVALTGR